MTHPAARRSLSERKEWPTDVLNLFEMNHLGILGRSAFNVRRMACEEWRYDSENSGIRSRPCGAVSRTSCRKDDSAWGEERRSW
jgi:hypothetical protein